MISGIDVSSIQGLINWDSVAAVGYQFAICRNGVGNDGLDASYSRNITGAKAAGLKVMAYNVVYPLQTDSVHPNRDPISQAQMHFNHSQDIIAALDLETPAIQDWVKFGITAKSINDWILEYAAMYSSLLGGVYPFLYSYPYYFNAISFDQEITKCPLWIASYTNVPVIPYPYTDYSIWQASGGNICLPGTKIPVDLDYIKDPNVLSALS